MINTAAPNAHCTHFQGWMLREVAGAPEQDFEQCPICGATRPPQFTRSPLEPIRTVDGDDFLARRRFLRCS